MCKTGMSFILYQTIPTGSGTVIVDVSIDGGPPQTVSSPCGDEPVFSSVLFKSDIMAEINHTVAVTNRGDPGTPFQFDKADISAGDVPNLWSPSDPVTNGFLLSTPVMTVTQAPTSAVPTLPATTLHSHESSKVISTSESHGG